MDNATLQQAIATTANNPENIGLLQIVVSNPPTQEEVSQIVDKINELITALKRV